MKYFVGNIGFNNPDRLSSGESLEDRQERLLTLWDNTVDYDDDVYVVGNVYDFRCLKGLKGNIYIVFGGKNDKKFMLNVVSQISSKRNETYDKGLFTQYLQSQLNVVDVYYESHTLQLVNGQTITLSTDILSETMHSDTFYLAGNMGQLQRCWSNGLNVDLLVNGNQFISEEDVIAISKEVKDKEDSLLF